MVEAIDNYDDLVALRKMYDVYTTIKQRGARSEFDIDRKEHGKPDSPKIRDDATMLPDEKPSSPESKQ